MPQFNGTLEVVDKNKAYQHIDNGGAFYEITADGSLVIETSYFGYGRSVIEIPYFNKAEFIKFLQQVEVEVIEE